jgi:anti-sigma B factor antagonist
MSLEATRSVREGVATITLSGEADSVSAPRLVEMIDSLAEESLHRLVLDLSGLTFLSSAGLRCLVFAHQKLGRGVEIVIANAAEDVLQTIKLTGFDRSVTIRRQLPT